MPKARSLPVSCLFAINKPTGHVSMQLLNKLQPLLASSPLFKEVAEPNQSGNKGARKRKWKQERVKMGQGGTLDPLADGVLVVGINKATKELSKFLDCTKQYTAIGLLGCSTDSYDSEGKRVKILPWQHVTEESIQQILSQFRGEIEQTPPIFSALKMDGKPLYEYARSNIPLPRPIPSRKQTVHALELLRFEPGGEGGHGYTFPKESLGAAEMQELQRMERMAKEGGTGLGAQEKPNTEQATTDKTGLAAETTSETGSDAPIFEISLTVSSGTYVRSIIHDIALALNTSAHVVKLTRTRQGEFTLKPAQKPTSDAPETSENNDITDTATSTTEQIGDIQLETFGGGCIEWEIFERGLKEMQDRKKDSTETGIENFDEENLREWENAILNNCKET